MTAGFSSRATLSSVPPNPEARVQGAFTDGHADGYRKGFADGKTDGRWQGLFVGMLFAVLIVAGLLYGDEAMKRPPIIEIYPGIEGGYYWRLLARNGKIIADGAESYTRRASCVKAAGRARDLMAAAEVKVCK